MPAGLHTKTVQPSSLERGIFDTTVQEKAVAFPTDSLLYNLSRVRLFTLALQYGVDLRQTYSWVFRQRKQAGREIKRLKTFLGRVYRDIQRKIEGRLELKSIFLPELVLAERLLTQERQDKDNVDQRGIMTPLE